LGIRKKAVVSAEPEKRQKKSLSGGRTQLLCWSPADICTSREKKTTQRNNGQGEKPSTKRQRSQREGALRRPLGPRPTAANWKEKKTEDNPGA